MKTPLLLAAVAAAIALTGCVHAPRASVAVDLSRLNPGMNKEEVIHAIGRPLLAATAADGMEVFRYRGGSGVEASTPYYGVVFKQGLLIEYGPEAGVRLGGQFAVRDLFEESWMRTPPSPTESQASKAP